MEKSQAILCLLSRTLIIFQFEIKERDKRREEEFRREHPNAEFSRKVSYRRRYIEEFLPPPEPE